MLIVLGLDSLDAERISSYPTPHIDSVVESGQGGPMNPGRDLEPEDLITQVLWPSLLAGGHPRTLFPSYYESDSSETKHWGNPLLDNRLAKTAEEKLAGHLSENVKRAIKRMFAAAGSSKSHIGLELLESEGSLMDDADSPKLISVPGVNEDDVNNELKSMIAPGETTGKSYEPAVDMTTFEQAAMKADAARLIRTLDAVDSRAHDFLLTHFFSLDLIQHVWANSDRKMSRWYGIYDDFVGRVLNEADASDTVVLVSDHGMQQTGVHSRRAFYACNRRIWDAEVWSLPGFRDAVRSELKTHDPETERAEQSDAVNVETRRHLEDLGYF